MKFEIPDKNDYIRLYLEESVSVISATRNHDRLVQRLGDAATACILALKSGGKILLAGNGGSAADAQHISGELLSRFRLERRGLRAIALTTDTSALTAIGNDYGYENLFARQIQAYGDPGDVLIAITTSGRSPNIVEAIRVGRKMGLCCVGLTGNSGGQIRDMCDFIIEVPSVDTQRIQEVHGILGHILCGLIEHAMCFGQ